MSTTLYWRPAPKNRPEPEDLPQELKTRLARRYWGHDGSLRSEALEFSRTDIPYLEGLADGGVAGASELATAIEQHGCIEVWIEP